MDQRLLQRGGTLLLSNTAGQALSFLTSVALGRGLGTEAFGQYGVVMALVFLGGILADFGLEVSLTREVARTPQASRPLLAAALLAKGLLGGALASGLALPPVAMALAPSPAAVPAVQLAGVLLTLNVLNGSFSAVFRAWGRMRYILAINVAGLGVQLAGVLALLRFNPSLTALIAWLIVVQVGELAAGVILFRREATPLTPAPALAWGQVGIEARALLRRSWPFLVSGLLGALTIRVDLFLLEALRGPATVGVYSVATRLHELLGLAPNAFFAALLPAMAALPAADGSRLYGQTVRRMALVGGVGAGVGLLLADALVGISFGPAYTAAAPSLRVLAVLLVPLLVNRTTTIHLYATGREGLANAGLALNLLARAGLGWGLISVWGAPGAALANLLAEIILLGIYWGTGAMRVPAPRLPAEVERAA